MQLGQSSLIAIKNSRPILFLLLIIGLFLTSFKVKAQLTPDHTLGYENSVVTPINQLIDRIDGGAKRGANLFHSFQEFNVGNGRSVYFANPVGIDNILSRITGSNPSEILGKLGVLGEANLFLINPNGIYFGANASLDIRGSLIATTAEGIQLGEKGIFSASHPQNSNLLSVQPSALFPKSLSNHQATITNLGNLSAGKNLTLVADNLNLQGQLLAGENLTLQATNNLQIRDTLAQPFIAAAGKNLLIQGNQKVDIFALNHPHSRLFSDTDLVLRSANQIIGDAHYWSGGNFRVEQLNGKLGNLLSLNDPVIRSLGDVSFNSYLGSSLHIFAAGKVEISGTILITNPDTINGLQQIVTLSDGTSITIDGKTQNTLDIRAGMKPTAVGNQGVTTDNSGFFLDSFFNLLNPLDTISPSVTSADIIIGDIFTDFILGDGGRVFLTNQYQPNPLLSGRITVGSINTGDRFGGGSVVIDGRSNVLLNGTVNTSALDLSELSPNFPANTFLGNGGDVTLLAKGNITLTPNASIFANGLLGGNLILKSQEAISATGSIIRSRSFTTESGIGGQINIQAKSLSLSNGALIVTSTFGSAKAGDVMISTTDSISVDGIDNNGILSSGIASVSLAEGKTGNLNLTTRALLITNGATLSLSPQAKGDAGDMTINTTDSVFLDGVDSNGFPSAIDIRSLTEGNGANLSITTGSFSINNGASILAFSSGEGKAGDVKISATDLVSLDGVGSHGLPTAITLSGGNLDITTGALSMTNGALIGAATQGKANAGNVTIRASQAVSFDGMTSDGSPTGIALGVNSNAEGNGGNLNITAPSLSVTNGALLGAATQGKGNAGNVTIRASQAVSFDGVGSNGSPTGIAVGVDSGAEGNAGTINLTAKSLSVRNGAVLGAGTLGKGNAGDVTIRVTDAVVVDGVGSDGESSLIGVRSQSEGNAGNLNITTKSLSITNGALLGAETLGRGNAGNVTLRVTDSVIVDGVGSNEQPSAIGVNSQAEGNAGNIRLTTGSLSLTNGAQINASSSAQGNAGSVAIQAKDSIRLIGSFTTDELTGILATAEGTGNAGDVAITTNRLLVKDGAQAGVSSSSSSNAGNLTVKATSIQLDNQAQLTAETNSGEGGNINLEVQDLLLMRRNSLISAESLSIGNSGNIDIDTKFLIAIPKENSDIIASAIRGGNIKITTEGIFGLEFRDKLTPRSDITATGTFTLITPEVDPLSGLVDLPANVVDVEGLVAKNVCAVQEGKIARGSSFVVTGRGGLPPNPNNMLTPNNGIVEWANRSQEEEKAPVILSNLPTNNQQQSKSERIIEQAQGWVMTANGTVILTATAPKATLQNPNLLHSGCLLSE